MKHIGLGGMDATNELIFKAFKLCLCTFKAFGVILWRFKVVQINQGSFKFFERARTIVPPGVILRA
jgi:hypothetical protein